MYIPKISFKEAVNFQINSNCFGYKITTLDKNKIKEYHENILLELSVHFCLDIEFIKLIESKIINLPSSKKNLFEDTLAIVEFENTLYKNNMIVNIFNNANINNLRIKINRIINFCNTNKDIYTIEQFKKYKKINGNFSKKLEKIIYDNYDHLINMKITNDDIKELSITIDDIYKYLNTKINQDLSFLFMFYKFINNLEMEELKKLKNNVESRINEEQIIFNEKVNALLSAKSAEISTYYDKIIKNLIQMNENTISKINEELEVLKKDKKEKEELEAEFINIQKIKSELEAKIEDCIKIIKSYEDKEKQEELEYTLKYDYDLITQIIKDSKNDLLLLKKNDNTIDDINFNADINICDMLP